MHEFYYCPASLRLLCRYTEYFHEVLSTKGQTQYCKNWHKLSSKQVHLNPSAQIHFSQQYVAGSAAGTGQYLEPSGCFSLIASFILPLPRRLRNRSASHRSIQPASSPSDKQHWIALCGAEATAPELPETWKANSQSRSAV